MDKMVCDETNVIEANEKFASQYSFPSLSLSSLLFAGHGSSFEELQSCFLHPLPC